MLKSYILAQLFTGAHSQVTPLGVTVSMDHDDSRTKQFSNVTVQGGFLEELLGKALFLGFCLFSWVFAILVLWLICGYGEK